MRKATDSDRMLMIPSNSLHWNSRDRNAPGHACLPPKYDDLAQWTKDGVVHQKAANSDTKPLYKGILLAIYHVSLPNISFANRPLHWLDKALQTPLAMGTTSNRHAYDREPVLLDTVHITQLPVLAVSQKFLAEETQRWLTYQVNLSRNDYSVLQWHLSPRSAPECGHNSSDLALTP